jgi:hypothetical protein
MRTVFALRELSDPARAGTVEDQDDIVTALLELFHKAGVGDGVQYPGYQKPSRKRPDRLRGDGLNPARVTATSR